MCSNNIGSFECQCVEGYYGDGVTCKGIHNNGDNYRIAIGLQTLMNAWMTMEVADVVQIWLTAVQYAPTFQAIPCVAAWRVITLVLTESPVMVRTTHRTFLT